MNKTVKRTSKIYDIPKLMDAEKAGSNESLKCKLFICEGDSAAGLGRIILSQSFKYNGLFFHKCVCNLREKKRAVAGSIL